MATATNNDKYYAVAVGRHTGIFNQWSQAQAETDKYPGACHKAFDTSSEVKEFLISSSISVDNFTSDLDEIITDSDIDVYKDDSIVCDSAVFSCTVSEKADHVFMLKCDYCSTWVHFECTELPPYQLALLRNSDRQFTCHSCTATDIEIMTTASQTEAEVKRPPVVEAVLEGEHSNHSCMQAIRDLESSLVDKLCGVVQENYDLKVQLLQKDLSNAKMRYVV